MHNTMTSIWTLKRSRQIIRRYLKKKITIEQAAKQIGCSVSSIRNKAMRTDLNLDHDAPKGRNWKKWTPVDMMALYAMKQKGTGWPEIGNALNRSPISVERCWEDTNWTEYLTSHGAGEGQSAKVAQMLTEKQLADFAISLARNNPERLKEVTKAYLSAKTGIKNFNYEDVMTTARQELGKLGLLRAEGKKFGPGTYIVVGDSHGRHTKRGMFRMLTVLQRHLKADAIIHIGHMLDDDNDVSCCWNEMNGNVIAVAKNAELKWLCQMNEDGRFRHEVLRNHIFLGDLFVGNQEIIQDYSLVPLGNLPRVYFERSAILNLHRHELATRTTCHEDTQLFSPGCLCVDHIVKVIRQQDFTDGRTIKLAYHDGFTKYQRMEHLLNAWERGLCVVHVDADGRFDVIQSRIYLTSRGWACSYFDKVITETSVLAPQQRIFFNGDLHCDVHDAAILSLQEQFCLDYHPHQAVDVGDLLNNKAFNHHIWKRTGHMGIEHQALREIAQAKWILQKRKHWADKHILLYGNHERFTRDFTERLPQLREMFEFPFMLDLESLGVQLVEHQQRLRIGTLQFIHGDMKMIGAKGGNKLDRIFNTFGRNTVIGHSHTAAVRMGCYMVGHSGLLEQGYNETEASAWINGFGYCNLFEDVPFVSLVHIRSKRFRIHNKTYRPANVDSWTVPTYKASINFEFQP